MHKHTVPFAAAVIAALLILSHVPVSAQGSPPIPTGGGSFNTTPVDTSTPTLLKPRLLSVSLALDAARFYPFGIAQWTPARSVRPVANRRCWWGGMAK